MKSLQTFFIAGAGSVGSGLAWALKDAGFKISGIWNRSPERFTRVSLPKDIKTYAGYEATGLADAMQDADVIVIAISDDAIESTSLALCSLAHFKSQTLIIHTSGCMPAQQLPAAKETKRGALHPLAALPDTELARSRLRQATYAVEGDQATQALLKELVEKLGGTSFSIRSHERGRYHAAAVMASNLVVSLLQQAQEQAALAGLDDPAPLLDLAIGALQASKEKDLIHALTGPVLRGDHKTIAKHLQVLDKSALDSYLPLSKNALKMARLRGLSAHAIWDIEQLLGQWDEQD
ncbi:MAG: DUF2520 domain-containing protein [Deltaproteobacteria bacterium]|nr:DUF2520 domain-containing protein [Deltaproteobacteria bacterium]MBT6432986.1 DUF2520 domain-containing protein [Deltaproteobacteria bacterium]